MTCAHPVCGQDTEGGMKKTTEAPSPDGKFAFRYTGEFDSENQTSFGFHVDEKPTASPGLERSLGRMEVRRKNLRQY